MKSSLSRKQRIFAVIFFSLVGLGWPGRSGLAAEIIPSPSSIPGKWGERISFDLRILTYGIIQEPARSSQNPGNNFLQMPRYSGNLEMRPDLHLNLDPLELSAKPRMRLEYRAWQEGNPKENPEWDDDWYINEWLARWKVRENLFISYGRENLQWGPSFLFSPSNPFFRDNGRRNPYLEVPGRDFGRLVWIPGSSWSISFIDNTDKGRNDINGPDPFEKIYALKIDYTGRQNYASMILAHREDSENSLGFLGGWTISDAILLYAEGAIAQGTKALYPKQDSSPFAASMLKYPQDDLAINPIFLAGGSYTFETNGTLTMEYAYYGSGYSDAEADTYYTLRRRAADAIGAGGLISALGQKVLGQTVNTGLRFLRKNYALLQYTQNNIKNNLDLTLRWTRNLDDGSGQLTTLVTYSLGNHLELFSVGVLTGGGKDTEFGSMIDYQLMLGLKYTY